MASYDVIIVGAGGSGAPLAARLSEDPEISVLLIEAGADHTTTDSFPFEIRYSARSAPRCPAIPTTGR